MSRLDEIAQHAETHDFSAEMETGKWEADTEADPMVTTSLRLPKSLLDWVREQAAEQQVRPTTLIRQWIEQLRRAGAGDGVQGLVTRVERLERAVFPDQKAS